MWSPGRLVEVVVDAVVVVTGSVDGVLPGTDTSTGYGTNTVTVKGGALGTITGVTVEGVSTVTRTA